MIPAPFPSLILVLAVYRVLRLAGWDTLPMLVRLRAWATGQEVITNGSTNARIGVTNEPVETVYRYRRPLLDKLITCPFCLGLWLSPLFYAAWLYEPRWTLYGCFPLALSAAAGLTAKVLDP